MPTLTKTNSSLPVRAGQAILEYLQSIPAIFAAPGLTYRRDDDPRPRPSFPFLVVKVSALRQSWAGSDEHEGLLQVCYVSGRDEDANGDDVSAQDADLVDNQEAHHAIAAAIGLALEDQVAARAFINFRPGTVRTVTDLHLYALLENVESGEFIDGGTCWQTEFARQITCARCDYL